MVRRSRKALVAGLLALPLVLGACSSDDPEPKIAAPESSAPTVSQSPTADPGPVEPTMPASAKGHDTDGAEAFVEFYWAAVNYAQSSGDLRLLRSLADENCGACSGGVTYLQDIFDRGGSVHGGEYSPADMVAKRLNTGDFGVTTAVSNTRQEVDFPGRKDDVTYRANEARMQFIVTPEQGGWVVAYWDKAFK